MRKLKLEVQLSVDGFMASPDGSTRWLLWNWTEDWNWDEALRSVHIELTTSSDCIILSGKMVEDGFINHWEKVGMNPSDPQYAFAKPINDMQKIVFSKKLQSSIWKNTTLCKGDLEQEILSLKKMKGRDLIVYGGSEFVSALISLNLIDEIYLFINPVAIGKGLSIFKKEQNLKLISSNQFESGIVVLKYEPVL